MGRPCAELTFTMSEAGAALGVSRRTVQRLIARGDLPALRLGQRVLVARIELAAWVERNANTSFVTSSRLDVGSHPTPAA